MCGLVIGYRLSVGIAGETDDYYIPFKREGTCGEAISHQQNIIQQKFSFLTAESRWFPTAIPQFPSSGKARVEKPSAISSQPSAEHHSTETLLRR